MLQGKCPRDLQEVLAIQEGFGTEAAVLSIKARPLRG